MTARFARRRALTTLLCILALLLCAGSPLQAQTSDDQKQIQALADKVDQMLAQRWKEGNVTPALLSDDAEFLRRAYLDIVGRIPTVSEARAFLDRKDKDKRAKLVDELLSRSGYVTQFTNFWRALLIPEANNSFIVKLQQNGFEEWLRERLKKNVNYDEFARDIITAKIEAEGQRAIASAFTGQPSSIAFFSAKEFKPESLAASTARVFLGVNLACAQCHPHPFADWKRDQFWQFAAFYSGMRSETLMDFIVPKKEVPDSKELKIPNTERTVQATYLDGSDPKLKEKTSTRDALAKWVTSPENPYFSRAAVNRFWAYFLGTGLVEPIDAMDNDDRQALHPELLNLLAKEFADHNFDPKFLIRVITATKAYQRSSASSGEGQSDPAMFARAQLRGLTPEQLFDSVATATGYRDSGGGNDLITGILGGAKSARSEFLTRFSSADRPNEAQRSILQALSLMNGRVTAAATSLENSETLAAVLDAPFASTESRIETLYLATLSRKPTETEMDRAATFVKKRVGKAKDSDNPQGDALADLFWVLLNSSEFVLNH